MRSRSSLATPACRASWTTCGQFLERADPGIFVHHPVESMGRPELVVRGLAAQRLAERLEHGVGDQRRGNLSAATVGVERVHGEPGPGHDEFDHVEVRVHVAVGERPADQARKETLDQQPAGQLVVACQLDEAQQGRVVGTGGRRTLLGGVDDLAEIRQLARHHGPGSGPGQAGAGGPEMVPLGIEPAGEGAGGEGGDGVAGVGQVVLVMAGTLTNTPHRWSHRRRSATHSPSSADGFPFRLDSAPTARCDPAVRPDHRRSTRRRASACSDRHHRRARRRTRPRSTPGLWIDGVARRGGPAAAGEWAARRCGDHDGTACHRRDRLPARPAERWR